jgi:predicted enzyme related to lactoylglutathione lyase
MRIPALHPLVYRRVLPVKGVSNCTTTYLPQKQPMTNPVIYFEIPVRDMDRAINFYSKTFDMTFERKKIDGNEMALFPYQPSGEGATGALAKGDSYEPSLKGTRVYFSTQDIDATLRNAISSGGRLIYPKTDTGDYGYVAEFEDSEGNCIALHMKKP